METVGIITYLPTPVFPSDTLDSLARRRYENEIQMLVDFRMHLAHPQNPFAGIAQSESRRRMKVEQEAELPKRFDQYKRRMLSPAEYTPGGQMPPGHSANL